MSNDIQKADQIAYRFYTKLALVLANARQTNEPQSSRTQTKTDKWFNIETPDSDLYRDHLRTYRSISSSASSSSSSPSSSSPAPGTLVLDVLLAVPEHTGHATSHVLVYHAPDSSRVRVEPTRRFVLLESWTLAFSPGSASSSPSISAASSAASSSSARTGDTSTTSSVYETEGGASAAGSTEGGAVAPSTTYKHGIPLFRSLYTLLRILPAWRFFKLLRGRRMPGPNRNGFLGIELRVRGLDTPPPEDILDFDTRISPGHAPLPTSSHVFPSIPHPLGTLTLSTRYLDNPAFQLDSLESLLSSRFLSLDEGPEFTPTLARQSQSQSQSQSHLSSQQQAQQGATAAGLSRSPPRAYGAGAGAGGHPSSFPRTPVSGLARSPPKSPRSPLSASAAAIAEQFVIPRDRDRDRDRDTSMHARTVSVPEHHQQASGGQMGASPRAAAVPLTRTSTPGGAALGRGEGGGGASVLSVASSSRPESSAAWTGSRVGGAGAGGEDALSGLAARIRKESLGTRSSVDLPGSPTTASGAGVPIRRPGLSPVNPFKSGTLSSGSPSLHSPSPSLRQSSPLAAGLPSRAGGAGLVGQGPTSPAASTFSNFPTVSSATPGTGVGAGAGTGTGTGTGTGAVMIPSSLGNRPSPPFAPSSLGARSTASAEGGEGGVQGAGAGVPARKRYSSSFGHRYAGSGASNVSAGSGTAGGAMGASPSSAGGVGAGGVGEGRPVSPAAVGGGGTGGRQSVGAGGVGGPGQGPGREAGATPPPTYLGAPTDDDDISLFVQDIDARRPLGLGLAPASLRPSSRGGRQQGSEDTIGPPSSTEQPAAHAPSSPSGLARHTAGIRMPSGVPSEVPEASEPASSARNSSFAQSARTLANTPSRLQTQVHTQSQVQAQAQVQAQSYSTAPGSQVVDGAAGSRGPVATREADVDAQLAQMNAAFLASLEGLGAPSSPASSSQPSAQGGSGGNGGNSNGSGSGNGIGLPPSLSPRSSPRQSPRGGLTSLPSESSPLARDRGAVSPPPSFSSATPGYTPPPPPPPMSRSPNSSPALRTVALGRASSLRRERGDSYSYSYSSGGLAPDASVTSARSGGSGGGGSGSGGGASQGSSEVIGVLELDAEERERVRRATGGRR
ncbi:hypothetical protein CONPUDRAFT_169288 [Coniophora puteana RWD-64-598 SS2]|uniref:Autophagy-related protein 13 n=1 Tax=Coniophora puteana (strain RWD-64-598) TaxID=741705 RepID=A0A5M3M861_CONPW|nr:uncharacterized protein CONPUDRAFT_169288 [Coniophora puteana RWD-64-598 SS2]EIW75418.1 hypothetical protein CONPUDRAFT_169288 [Coniophora puteana RWD-64-598 SS2]